MKVWVIIACSLVVIVSPHIFGCGNKATEPSDYQIEQWQTEDELKMEKVYEEWDRISEQDSFGKNNGKNTNRILTQSPEQMTL